MPMPNRLKNKSSARSARSGIVTSNESGKGCSALSSKTKNRKYTENGGVALIANAYKSAFRSPNSLPLNLRGT